MTMLQLQQQQQQLLLLRLLALRLMQYCNGIDSFRQMTFPTRNDDEGILFI